MSDAVLTVDRLAVEIRDSERVIRPVDDASFAVAAGECLGLVGESGCGKSLTLRAILGVLPANARIASGSVGLQGERPEAGGASVAMVFQEPVAALNPLLRVGDLIADAYRAHSAASRRQAREKAVELLREVGVPAPERRATAFPHELSGGLRQRALIAMALATDPDVLLCDEPTTALDVTVQRQILRLLDRIRQERDLAIVYVTHDLAVVREICDRVAVMYAGRVIERGQAGALFARPAHPYTQGLLRSVPSLHGDGELFSIGGSPPDPRAFPTGCRFHPRCYLAHPDCPLAAHRLAPVGGDGDTACIHHELLLARASAPG